MASQRVPLTQGLQAVVVENAHLVHPAHAHRLERDAALRNVWGVGVMRQLHTKQIETPPKGQRKRGRPAGEPPHATKTAT